MNGNHDASSSVLHIKCALDEGKCEVQREIESLQYACMCL